MERPFEHLSAASSDYFVSNNYLCGDQGDSWILILCNVFWNHLIIMDLGLISTPFIFDPLENMD